MSNTTTLPTQLNPIRTPNVDAIINLCLDAQENGRFVAIGDETGYGKSTGLRAYLALAGTHNAWYALWDTTMGKKDFLVAILSAMGLNVEGSIHDKVMRIVAHMLATQKPLLIIDTCGELSMGCYRLIQVIYDHVHMEKQECGMVLCGTDDFRKHIFKMAGKGRIGFPELKRRIEYWLPLSPPARKYVEIVCGKMQITDAPAINYVYNTCKNFGSINALLCNYAKAVNKGKALPQAIDTLKGLQFGESDLKISNEQRTKAA